MVSNTCYYRRNCCTTAITRRGVAALDFNSDGTRLVSVGLDDEHSIAVCNTATTSTSSSATTSSGTLLYSSKGNRSRVLDLRCSPYDAQRFVVCGAKHIDFWGSSGGALKCERGLLKTAATAALLCTAWLGPSSTVYGSASGTLIACSGREVVPCSSSGTAAGSGKKAVDNSNSSGNSGSSDGGRAAHAGPLNALWVIRSDSSSSGSSSSAVVQGLLTGGKDGHVIRWSVTPTGTVGDRLWAVSLATSMLTSAPGGASPSADSCICSICLSSDGTKLLLGTQGSEIYELSAPTSAVPGNGSTAAVGSTVLRGGDAVVRGHCKDELWGLAVDATGSEYCTVGDDGMLSLWSVAERRQMAAVSVAGMARACAYRYCVSSLHQYGHIYACLCDGATDAVCNRWWCISVAFAAFLTCACAYYYSGCYANHELKQVEPCSLT
jgi:echinoderm microtubule-associated protein-like 6